MSRQSNPALFCGSTALSSLPVEARLLGAASPPLDWIPPQSGKVHIFNSDNVGSKPTAVLL
jgi:hypothetical protein